MFNRFIGLRISNQHAKIDILFVTVAEWDVCCYLYVGFRVVFLKCRGMIAENKLDCEQATTYERLSVN